MPLWYTKFQKSPYRGKGCRGHPLPQPINRRGGEGRSLIERSDYRIGGGYPETRDFPRDSGDSLNGESVASLPHFGPSVEISWLRHCMATRHCEGQTSAIHVILHLELVASIIHNSLFPVRFFFLSVSKTQQLTVIQHLHGRQLEVSRIPHSKINE